MEKPEEKPEDEISLLDYLIVLAKRKKLVIIMTLFFTLTAIIYSYTTPSMYMANAKILPLGIRSQNTSGMRQILSQLPGFGNFASIDSSINHPNTLLEILYSRPTLDILINKLKSMERYKEETDWETLKSQIREIAEAGPNKKKSSNIIVISVKDTDPQRAADIANTLVEALDSRIKALALTDASRRRLFFENQLQQAKENLIQSEIAMMEYQEESGVLSVESQSGAVLNLRAQLASKEIELKVMKTYSTSNNPDLQKLEDTLKGIRIELAKLEKKDKYKLDSIVPVDRTPSVFTDYIRKSRDLKFNEKLFELMLSQYESAKMDEAKDHSTIKIIEKALPPKMRFRPRRASIIMKLTVVGFFFSVFVVFLVEYLEKMSAAGSNKERFDTFKRYLSFRKSN